MSLLRPFRRIAMNIVDRLISGPHSIVILIVVFLVKNDTVATITEAILTPRGLHRPGLIVVSLSAALPGLPSICG